MLLNLKKHTIQKTFSFFYLTFFLSLYLDNWFPYSGMIEHNNKIVYKKNTSAIDLDVINTKTIVIKNDMTKYKLKKNVK